MHTPKTSVVDSEAVHGQKLIQFSTDLLQHTIHMTPSLDTSNNQVDFYGHEWAAQSKLATKADHLSLMLLHRGRWSSISFRRQSLFLTCKDEPSYHGCQPHGYHPSRQHLFPEWSSTRFEPLCARQTVLHAYRTAFRKTWMVMPINFYLFQAKLLHL